MIVSSLFVRGETLTRLDEFLKVHHWLICYSKNGQESYSYPYK